MSEDTLETYAPEEPGKEAGHKPDVFRSIRKLVFTLFALALAWVIFSQVIPRLTLPESKSQSQTSRVTPHTTPSVSTKRPFDAAPLHARIEALETQIATLKEQVTTTPDHSKTNAQLARMQESITALEQRPSSKLEALIISQQETIKTLQSSVEAMQNATGSHLAGLTAFGQLRETMLRGEPFAYELKRLKTMTKNRQDIQGLLTPLARISATGMPTKKVLTRLFERAVPHALSPGIKPDSIMANVKSLIRIRKTGTPKGKDSDAIIARAETALQEGRLQASIHILKALPPSAITAFSRWKMVTQKHILCQEILDTLEVTILKKQLPEKPIVLTKPGALTKEVLPPTKIEQKEEPENVEKEIPVPPVSSEKNPKPEPTQPDPAINQTSDD